MNMKKFLKSSNNTTQAIFLSKGFVVGLIILFCNDFFFKELFHNWITGKLSDFSGLFVFAIFWAAIFPKKSKIIYVGVAAFFIFWKSPLSEPLILRINSITFLNYVRIIDWTDLIALTILPLAYRYQVHFTTKRLIKIPVIIPIFFASFLFVATSYDDDFRNGILIDEEYEFSFSQDSLYSYLNRIDSVMAGGSDSTLRDSAYFNISFYSYNCERRLYINSQSFSLTDTSGLLNLITVYEGENCYKVADPKLVEQSIQNLITEIEEEIIDKLE
jgi:hypothetical protein